MEPGNELDVDQEALAAEAAAIVPPEDLVPPGPTDQEPAPGADQELAPGEPAPSSWAPVTPSIVALVDKLVCPAWELTAAEKLELAEALAPVLDQVFPGGLGSERWAPYVRLAFVAAGITLARYDGDRGKFRPLRNTRTSSSSSSAPAAERLGAGDDGPAGGFSTAAH